MTDAIDREYREFGTADEAGKQRRTVLQAAVMMEEIDRWALDQAPNCGA